ncbi:MAG: hypothetical protein AAFY19_04105 [Pseudomonadota bacterium]
MPCSSLFNLRSAALAFLAAAACVSSGAAAAPPSDCFSAEEGMDPNSVVQGTSGERGVVILYFEQCDGSLYIFDRSDMAQAARVNESWRFEELISMRLTREGIEITAKFISGIGPRAAEPFGARFIANHKPGGGYTVRQDESYTKKWGALDPDEWGITQAPSLSQLMAPVLLAATEEFEEQPAVIMLIERKGLLNPMLPGMAKDLPSRAGRGQAAILVERRGLLDDSVFADRHYAIAYFTNGQWRFDAIYRQFLCARGTKPRQWKAGLCS